MCRLYYIGTFFFFKVNQFYIKSITIVQKVSSSKDGWWMKENTSLGSAESFSGSWVHPSWHIEIHYGHYKNAGWGGCSLTTPWLTHRLFNFWDIVKFSPGSLGSWTQRLNESRLRVRGVHSLPSPARFKTLEHFDPTGCCQNLHKFPQIQVGSPILKHVVLVTVWLDGVPN